MNENVKQQILEHLKVFAFVILVFSPFVALMYWSETFDTEGAYLIGIAGLLISAILTLIYVLASTKHKDKGK
ncbi:hypothetical protein KAU43_06315 [candidate division WOR-3 bacterium]|nr:hypothetical protein [candidate division WOR-3 bacterium]